jgi:hypothetical protein
MVDFLNQSTIKSLNSSFQKKQEPISTKIFGVPLKKIMKVENEKLVLPSAISVLFHYIDKNGLLYFWALKLVVETKGLFRVPANKEEINRMINIIDSGGIPVLEPNKEHVVCGVIATFVKQLQEPLLTYTAANDFIDILSRIHLVQLYLLHCRN